MTKHSPLGASGAERWMNCPGSVALLKHLELPESDDPTYRQEGTAMHAAAEACLTQDMDTWEITGQEFEGVVIDAPMADAVQEYVSYARTLIPDALNVWVEYPVSSPVHKDFYGTMDFGAELPDEIHVVDLKGGKGIVVDPDDNPQLKYYAFGLIDAHPQWPGDLKVVLTIAQPRAWHSAGPIRTWETTVGAIRAWVKDTLVPAMLATEHDHTLDAGPWCRFCPAKLVCPLLTSLFRAACVANPKEIVNVSADSLGRSYQYVQAVKFYIKGLEDETLRRLNTGTAVPGTKLVNKRADRVWKEGADELAKSRFGTEAYTQPALKSPPNIEKLSPAGKEFVREFAYTPSTGVTVALETDSRIAVKVQTSAEAFGASVAALTQEAA